MKKIGNFFEPIPFAFISLALAFGALGSGWTQYKKHINNQLFSFSASWVPFLTMTFVCLFVLFLTLKIIFNYKWFRDDFIKNRITSAHFSVYPLVLMSIGEFILPYQAKNNNMAFTNTGSIYVLGMFFWYVGLILSILFLIYWLILEIKKFEWANVDAVWYVPPAALAGACTNPSWLGNNYESFLKIWWYIIFILVVMSMIFVWYRYLFIKGHDSELPSIGVLSSVNSFMLLTYANTFGFNSGNFQFGIVFFLGATSMTTTLIIYITMIKTFRGKFVPGLSSYSFPLSASAAARMFFAHYMVRLTSSNPEVFNFFLVWAFIELIIATIVNIYLFFGLNWYLFRGYFPVKNIKKNTLPTK